MSVEMQAFLVVLFLFALNGACIGEIICPDPTSTLSVAQYNQAWICELINWRNTLATLKEQIERECTVSNASGRWQPLFGCPDFSNITCVNTASLDNETDLFNCTITFCSDGQYLDQAVLLGLWKQHFLNQKKIIAVSKLISCKRSDCEGSTSVATVTTTASTTASNTDSDTTSQLTTTDGETTVPSATENAVVSVTTASLSYETVSASCDGVNILNGTSGAISSPYYPSYYQNYANCSWEISVPDGMVIAVKSAATFAVETSTTCAYDALTFDNDMTVCGHDVFPSFRTDNNQLRVTFTSDYSVTDRGFLISWEAVDNSSIPSPYISNVSANHGTISTPNYPSEHGHFMDYTWIIRAPDSGWFQPAISIEFEPLFDLEGVAGRACPYDSLTISAGSQPPSDSAEKVVLCDSTQPSKLLLKSSEAYISFKTDNSISGAGFSFNFTAFDFCADGCYWIHYNDLRITYSEAQSICESRESVVAIVPTEEVYDELINNFRSQLFPLGNWYFATFWVGMTVNSTSGNFLPEDAYYSWDGTPYISASRTNIEVNVRQNKIYSAGMQTSDPNWFIAGVACWKKPGPVNASSPESPQLVFPSVIEACHDVGHSNGTDGVISSTKFLASYQNYANCSWTITVPDGMVIAVKSDKTFAVEQSITTTTCEADYLTLDYSKKLCGYDAFPSFWTNSSQLTVTFTSDRSVTDRGFSFHWSAVDKSSIPSPYISNVSANHGTISSPNYPSEYGCFLDYTWIIRAPDSGWFQPAISIEFESLFDLEGVAGKICPYDSLTISTGSQPPTDEMEKVVLCDSTQPSKLLIKSSELYVSFKTDNSINGAGFSFNFTAFDSCEGGDCYWTHFQRYVYIRSYEQAQEICESRDSVVAVVPNEEAYHTIIKDFRSELPVGSFSYIWVGMTFNTTSNKPIPEDAYYLWKPGFPLVSDDRASGIFIEISKNKYSGQGMINYNPAWLNPEGVSCWRPPIKADGTTSNYGYGTSEPTSNRG